jgi:hypothetical protein
VILRLAGRDLRHRPGEAAMLVVIIAAATAALTLGLVLQGTAAHPYQATRDATSGPDALATDFPAGTGAPALLPASRSRRRSKEMGREASPHPRHLRTAVPGPPTDTSAALIRHSLSLPFNLRVHVLP